MSETVTVFAIAWLLCQVASILMLRLGSRPASHPILVRLGEKAHRQKLAALERFWPLTAILPALERGDVATCTAILASLIALKSIASLAFGVVMVFWLPFACLMLPSIIAVHDPDNPEASAWVYRVATLQLTSHTLAAALGFTGFVKGPLEGVPISSVVDSSFGPAILVGIASLGFAVAAGRAESRAVMQHGI